MSDKRRQKAIERARKFAAYEEDMSVTPAEREAFTKQLEALMKKWNITEDELYPPEEEPEPQVVPGRPQPGVNPFTGRASSPRRPAPKAKKGKGGKVDAGEALEFLGGLLDDFLR